MEGFEDVFAEATWRAGFKVNFEVRDGRVRFIRDGHCFVHVRQETVERWISAALVPSLTCDGKKAIKALSTPISS